MSAEFELLRFEAAPVSPTVAVLELDGRFLTHAPARVRLLVERGGRGVEVPAVTSGGEDPWTASFAIALADATDDRTEFSLVPGRGPLVGLPAPEMGTGPDEDRFVRLARQTNELRHRLTEATAAGAAAEELRSELAAAERRRAEEGEELRAQIAAAERRGEEEAERLRGEVAAAARRADDALGATSAAEAERDAAAHAADQARSEQSGLRDALRAVEARASDAERDRAALRARAESADRATAEQRERADAAEQRVAEADARAVAAEDETRLARRDLRDTRARLESLLREQRRPVPGRHGHEVPEPDDEPPGSPPEAEPTAVLETREIATALEPGDEGDDKPGAQPATATRPTRVVRISDLDDGEDEHDHQDREPRIHRAAPITDEGDVLDPAAVGARFISPAETKAPMLTPARIMVGIAILLLVVALIAIMLGAGIV